MSRTNKGLSPAAKRIIHLFLFRDNTSGKEARIPLPAEIRQSPARTVMESIWTISLIALWGILLINLILTLRLVRWMRVMENMSKEAKHLESIPELALDAPAPDFTARTLDGEPVSLSTYAGKPVAFLFVSTHCGSCRQKLPSLMALSQSAREKAGVAFVLVCDTGTNETYTWITTLQQEDKLVITMPILVAPRRSTNLVTTYNPRGLTPYYCLLDAKGIVQSRGPVGMGDWSTLEHEWQSTSGSKHRSRLKQYW